MSEPERVRADSDTIPHDTLAAFAERIRRQRAQFDLGSLLELLAAHGWDADDVRFASHYSTVSQPCLIHDVELVAEPRHVRIILNMGLLGPQSPLPSYFFKKLDTGKVDVAMFLRFIGFFDHAVLGAYARALYPERDRHLFPDERRAKRNDVLLLNLASCSTLHWLFATVFPELGVRIEKVMLDREIKTSALKLGTTVLGGDSTFGHRSTVAAPGRRVTLYTEDERAGSGRPWLTEIPARMEAMVLPLVRSAGVEFELFLVIAAQQTWAKLESESYLGYDRVRGGTQSYRRVKLLSETRK